MHLNIRKTAWQAGGAYSTPSDPIAGGEGAGYPLPQNLTPAFDPSGLSSTARANPHNKIMRTLLSFTTYR